MTDPLDGPAAAHTTTVGLSIRTLDLQVRRTVSGIFQQLAEGDLAVMLQAGDPLAHVSVDRPEVRDVSRKPELLGIRVTTSDDNTVDSILTLLEEFARGPLRDALETSDPDSLFIMVDSSDGTVIWC